MNMVSPNQSCCSTSTQQDNRDFNMTTLETIHHGRSYEYTSILEAVERFSSVCQRPKTASQTMIKTHFFHALDINTPIQSPPLIATLNKRPRMNNIPDSSARCAKRPRPSFTSPSTLMAKKTTPSLSCWDASLKAVEMGGMEGIGRDTADERGYQADYDESLSEAEEESRSSGGYGHNNAMALMRIMQRYSKEVAPFCA